MDTLLLLRMFFTHIDGFVAEVLDVLWSHVERRLTGHQKHWDSREGNTEDILISFTKRHRNLKYWINIHYICVAFWIGLLTTGQEADWPMQSVRYSRPIRMSSLKNRMTLATLLNRMMLPRCCSTVTDMKTDRNAHCLSKHIHISTGIRLLKNHALVHSDFRKLLLHQPARLRNAIYS